MKYGEEKTGGEQACPKEKSLLHSFTLGYLIVLFVGLPLYMQDGLVLIGDAKYQFFRNVSVAFGGALLLLWLGRTVVVAVRARKSGERLRKPQLSATDWFVLAYLLAGALSLFFAVDRREGFWGYPGWYMGFFSQLLFVGIYFAVSRFWEGSRLFWYLAGLAAGAVMLLGVLNQLDYDVLHVFKAIQYFDWNRTHLLSTIGNSNWYAGYVGTLAGIAIAAMCCGKGWLRALGTAGVCIYAATALTMGCLTGDFTAVGLFLVLLIVALDGRKRLMRAVEAAALLPLVALVIKGCVSSGRFNLMMRMEAERDILMSRLWVLPLAGLAALWLFLWVREKKGSPDMLQKRPVRKYAERAFVGAALCAAGAALWLLLAVGQEALVQNAAPDSIIRRIVDAGSCRFILWSGTLQLFGKAGALQKLFGVGPDCFYHILYERNLLGMEWIREGLMDDTVYTNAHNELLSQLMNEGIFGMLAYAGIFVTMLYRLRARLWKNPMLLAAFLGVTGYIFCSVFTFQQVTSTPFVFALLGLAEAMQREEKQVLWYGAEGYDKKERDGEEKKRGTA